VCCFEEQEARVTPIEPTTEQRKEIERRRKGTLDRWVYQRLTAFLAVAAGKSREDVAEVLGVSPSQLGEWLRVYRRDGGDRPETPEFVWTRESFAVAKSRESSRYEEVPRYDVSPEQEAEIMTCLTRVLLLIDPCPSQICQVGSREHLIVARVS
jgi:transposase-like protein